MLSDVAFLNENKGFKILLLSRYAANVLKGCERVNIAWVSGVWVPPLFKQFKVYGT